MAAPTPIAFRVASHNAVSAPTVAFTANSFTRISDGGGYTLAAGDFLLVWIAVASPAARTLAQLTPKVNDSLGANYTDNIGGLITQAETHNVSATAWYRFQGSTVDTGISLPGLDATTSGMSVLFLVFQNVHTSSPLAGVTPVTSVHNNGAKPDPGSITTAAAINDQTIIGFAAQSAATGIILAAPSATPYDATARYTGFALNNTGTSAITTGYGIKTGVAPNTAFNASIFTGGSSGTGDAACSLTFVLRPMIYAIAPADLTSAGKIGAPPSGIAGPAISAMAPVAPVNLTSASLLDSPTVSWKTSIVPAALTSASLLTSPGIAVMGQVAPDALTSATLLTSPSIGALAVIAPLSLTSASELTSPSLSWKTLISPADMASATVLTATSIVAKAAVYPADLFSPTSTTEPLVVSPASVSPHDLLSPSILTTTALTIIYVYNADYIKAVTQNWMQDVYPQVFFPRTLFP